jgi:CheY-like chemotaxis protein
MHADPTKLQSDLLHALVHDLRTPLQTLLTWAQVLRQGGLSDSDARDALEILERNAALQRDILDRFVEMSSVLDGSLVLELQDGVDLCALLREAISRVELEAGRQGLVRVASPQEPVPVRCDGGRLREALVAVIKATLAAHGAGEPLVVALEHQGEQAIVHCGRPGPVSEMGAVAAERHALMLAVASRVVALHGGVLSAGGTASAAARAAPSAVAPAPFTIHIPVARGATRPAGGADGEPDARAGLTGAAATPRGKRVLVLDDEPDLRDMLARLLIDDGFEVQAAESTAEAVRIAGEFRPQLLIVDWLLGEGESGAEALRSLRGVCPAVGAIIVSGLPPVQVRKALADVDVVDILEKPFPMRKLVERVRTATA